MAVFRVERNKANHTPVMQVNDSAVVSYFMVVQKQVSEIRTPFLIYGISVEILFELVFKYFMRFPVLITGIFRTDYGAQPQLRVHVFMYRCGAVVISSACQINCHAPVAINAIVSMIDFADLCLCFLLLGIIIRLPVQPVVIVSIRTNI